MLCPSQAIHLACKAGGGIQGAFRDAARCARNVVSTMLCPSQGIHLAWNAPRGVTGTFRDAACWQCWISASPLSSIQDFDFSYNFVRVRVPLKMLLVLSDIHFFLSPRLLEPKPSGKKHNVTATFRTPFGKHWNVQYTGQSHLRDAEHDVNTTFNLITFETSSTMRRATLEMQNTMLQGCIWCSLTVQYSGRSDLGDGKLQLRHSWFHLLSIETCITLSGAIPGA